MATDWFYLSILPFSSNKGQHQNHQYMEQFTFGSVQGTKTQIL